jgi:thymidine kinase
MMMQTIPRTGGWVEVVCGPMFSGKSEELLRRLTRAAIANQRVELVRPASDTRHDGDELVTHAGRRMTAHRTSDLEWIRDLDVEVLGLDEIQFFPEGILEVVDDMAGRGVRVVCSGLDMDYRRRPWPVIQTLLSRAEFIDKLQAVCLCCGGPATLSQRLEADGSPAPAAGSTIEIGSGERYEARCRACHEVS